MELLETVAQRTGRCLARYEAQVGERALLAAVSGGVDSTALVLVLARLAATQRLRVPVHVAHVDHGVRSDGPQAAAHVEQLAERLGLPFVFRCLTLSSRRPSESAMREARYRVLSQMADEVGARTLLTGHHADDNIETVLFRMLRGTGIRGLAGIPESRWLSAHLLVVRPLLDTRRSTLEQLLAQVGVAPVEDPTNRDLRYARNRLRHETIPDLRRTVGASLESTLLGVSRTARAAADLLEAQGSRLLATLGTKVTPWRMELELGGDHDLPRPFLEEMLRQAHRSLCGEVPPRYWCARAAQLLQKPAGRRLQGRSGLLVERIREGLLILDESRAGSPPDEPLPFAPDSGRLHFGDTEWWMEGFVHPAPPLSPSPREVGPLRALLDPHQSPRPWRIRHQRQGDRFRPLGAAQSLELRRFLQRRHLPRFDRVRLPLLTDAADRILWCPGVEVAETARLRLNTRHCVELRAGRG